jgi:fused signal recognition particle receptor
MDNLISILTPLFNHLGISSPNEGDVLGLSAILFILLTGIGFFLLRAKSAERLPEGERESLSPEEREPPSAIEDKKLQEVVEEQKESADWTERLGKGLAKSRKEVWGKLGRFFSASKIDDKEMEEVEEILYSSDLGPKTVHELMEAMEEKRGEVEDFKEFLYSFLKEKIVHFQSKVDPELTKFTVTGEKKPRVIMVVGVNGVGKTTTIGKLATKLTKSGAKVVVGAGDTFRAAAVDQLETWCKRAGAMMVRAKEGASPSGVGYQALEKAMAEKADYCILDTAGRLHTKGNLMEELKKSKDVLKKLDIDAPWQTLLVIDAITGQNAIAQAEQFHKALELTGIILTKCDGSSKAGAVIPIVQSLKVPITFIGVGETVDDLNTFDTDDYLKALLALA